MELQITIESTALSDIEIKELLEARTTLQESGINLELRRQGIKYRNMPDPTILVAIVGLTGSAVGVLISGLLQIIQQKTLRKIVIHSPGGAILEIPADTPLEYIDKLIEKIKQMDLDKIILT